MRCKSYLHIAKKLAPTSQITTHNNPTRCFCKLVMRVSVAVCAPPIVVLESPAPRGNSSSCTICTTCTTCTTSIVLGENVRRDVDQPRARLKGEGDHLDEHVHVEEVDGALAAVVVVLPAPHAGVVVPQPLVHKGHNLLRVKTTANTGIRGRNQQNGVH
jgi:hypothetical protein